MWLGTRKR